MICVECTNPNIDRLYSQFKSKYIQLTVCPQCGNIADKYIEFDNVILFLDVLLLKPQAYRHVAFNLVEEEIFNKPEAKRGFLKRYKKIVRYAVLCVLFEVYLKWAYEEKNDHHNLLKSEVLHASVSYQYGFFICQQLVEKAAFCVLSNVLYINVLGFGQSGNKNLSQDQQRPFFSCVLLVTIFVSMAVKCLPIIMLIWPYDNANVASTVVEVLSVFNMMEALKMNTNLSYPITCCLAIALTFLLALIRDVTMCCLVGSFSSNYATNTLLIDILERMAHNFWYVVHLLHASFADFTKSLGSAS